MGGYGGGKEVRWRVIGGYGGGGGYVAEGRRLGVV